MALFPALFGLVLIAACRSDDEGLTAAEAAAQASGELRPLAGDTFEE